MQGRSLRSRQSDQASFVLELRPSAWKLWITARHRQLPGQGEPGMMDRHSAAPVTPLPIESRARLRLRSLGWALLAAAAATAAATAAASLPLALPSADAGSSGSVALLDPLLRSAGCGFFYGLLAFHLQRVDPDDSHLQAGLVGAVCGIRSLAAPLALSALEGGSSARPLAEVLPAVMMEIADAWLPLWWPLVGSALVLHLAQRLMLPLRP
jgi:hypothetical protein